MSLAVELPVYKTRYYFVILINYQGHLDTFLPLLETLDDRSYIYFIIHSVAE